MTKCTRMLHAINNVIHVWTLLFQNLVLNVSPLKEFAKLQTVLCVCKNVIYIAFCLSYSKQGVGSTLDWKTRLRNYKSHIKKKLRSCSLANHFVDVCSDTEDPSKIYYNWSIK